MTMLRPAALGGLFIGVLSALPLVGVANCCCCLWVVGGGLLAAHLASSSSATSLSPVEGALVGGSAGIIGAFVWVPVALMVAAVMAPFQRAFAGAILSNARDLPPEARQWLESWGESSSIFQFIIGFVSQFFAGAIFGAIGGVLGAMFFRKDVPPALGGTYIPPLPPQ